MYPVNVTRQLSLKSLSVAEFGNRKLPGNLPSSANLVRCLVCFWQTAEGEGGEGKWRRQPAKHHVD